MINSSRIVLEVTVIKVKIVHFYHFVDINHLYLKIKQSIYFFSLLQMRLYSSG